jgi:glycosyltransferase involved in cell wall biosynthesis
MSGLARAAVIVPARNEAAAIGGVVADLREAGAARVIVVDNDSRDGTAAIARAAGAEVVGAERAGYGWACLAGVHAARDAEIVAFIDGDGSFRASDLDALAAIVAAGRADLAVGARCGARMPAHQRLGNALTCAVIRAFYGVGLRDVGPLRAIRGDVLRRLDMRGSRYAWLVEMLAKAARVGARIAAREVSYGARRGGRSKVSGSARGSLLAGVDFLRALVSYRTW